jgi:hypothetical protein
MLLLALCLSAVWLGRTERDSGFWAGVVGAAFFAFAGVAIVMNLRINSMTPDRDGFELVFGFRKTKQRYRWKDVSAFEREYILRDSVVAFDDAGKRGGVLAVVDRALGFRNSNLLEDYGLGEEQLAELLNHWRDRALANREFTHPPSAPQ